MSSKETREKIRLMCEMHAALKSGPNREVTNTTELRQCGIYMETPCLTGEEGSDFCSSHVQCVFRTLSRLLFEQPGMPPLQPPLQPGMRDGYFTGFLALRCGWWLVSMGH